MSVLVAIVHRERDMNWQHIPVNTSSVARQTVSPKGRILAHCQYAGIAGIAI
jgi:hypothetical protein